MSDETREADPMTTATARMFIKQRDELKARVDEVVRELTAMDAQGSYRVPLYEVRRTALAILRGPSDAAG